MHEGHFTEEIISTILKQVYPEAGSRVRRICVRVGEMLHLEPESVHLHFEMLTQGGPLEGAELVFDEVPVRVCCQTCGSVGNVEDHHWLACANCGSKHVTLLDGNSITIKEIQYGIAS